MASYGVIQDDPTENDFQLNELDSKHDKRIMEAEKEREKRQRKEAAAALEKDPQAIAKQRACSIWSCHPRCGFECNRRDEGAIQAHQETCGYQIERLQERKSQMQKWQNTFAELRGVLTHITWGKITIEEQKRKIERETRDQQQGWDTVVAMANSKIEEQKRIIERAQIDKHKLLNSDLNGLSEKLNAAVQDYYMQFVKLPEEKKNRFEIYIENKGFPE